MSDSEQPQVVDEKYVLERYQKQIDYYWKVSRDNKHAYKRYRSWTTILGALVTLVSSISAASFIQNTEWISVLFAIATPIIAATLTVLNGMGQNFHWGASWRDMVVNATRLEKERDRFLALKREDRNIERELDILNSIVLEETRKFFQRVMDSEITSEKEPNAADENKE